MICSNFRRLILIQKIEELFFLMFFSFLFALRYDADFSPGEYTIQLDDQGFTDTNFSFLAVDNQNIEITSIYTNYSLSEDTTFEIPKQIEFNDIHVPVTKIRKFSLSLCGIANIILPETITTAEEAWLASRFIRMIDASKINVTNPPKYFFSNIMNATEIKIPTNIIELKVGAFAFDYNLTTININYGIIMNKTSSGFYNCSSLVSINLSKVLMNKIPDQLFKNCANLQSVIFPNYTSFGAYVFSNSFISDFPLYDNVEYAEGCFGEMLSTHPISAPDGIFFNNSIPQAAFDSCLFMESAVLREGLIRIPRFLFWNCTSLISIVFPSTIYNVAEKAFYFVPMPVLNFYHTNLTNLDGYAFSGFHGEEVILPDKNFNFPNGLFSMSTITRFNFSARLNNVGDYFFNSTNLTIANISCLTYSSIGSYCFHRCLYLEEVYLPDIDLFCGNSAFAYSPNLKYLKFTKRASFSYNCMDHCTSLEYVMWGSCSSINNAVCYCNYNMRYFGPTVEDVTKVTPQVDLHNFTTYEFGALSFSNLYLIEYVYIGPGFSYIGDASFRNDTSLITVDMVDCITSTVSYESFMNCTQLTNVYLPKDLRYIRQGAFVGTPELNIFYCGTTSITNTDGFSSGVIIHYYGLNKHVLFNGMEPMYPGKCWRAWDSPPYPPFPTKTPDVPYFIPKYTNALITPEPEKVLPAQTYVEDQKPNEYGPEFFKGRKSALFATALSISIVFIVLIVIILFFIFFGLWSRFRRVDYYTGDSM